MSFEELLQQARSEGNYDQMKCALIYIVERSQDILYIA